MSGRRSTGKRLRFEIFKRDHFTCQYCGAQPPSIVLVIDHIDPVAEGGLTVIENLITACEPCNQGKAHHRDLQDEWVVITGQDWHPADQIVLRLLSKYSARIVERAMADVAGKVGSGYLRTYGSGDRWVPYLFKVAQTMAREFESEIGSEGDDDAT